MTESGEDQSEVTEQQPIARPRSILLIGAIAYGLLFWMLLVVCLLIAWKLSTQN